MPGDPEQLPPRWEERAVIPPLGSAHPTPRKSSQRGRRCGREPGLAQMLRQLSSFITVDADHEGSREQKPGQGFPGKAHSPQGWTGWEARLENVGGRRPGDPPSPENIWRQRTPLPPTICYTLIPQGGPRLSPRDQSTTKQIQYEDPRHSSGFFLRPPCQQVREQTGEGGARDPHMPGAPARRHDGGEPPALLGTWDGARAVPRVTGLIA